jgi:para-nitrobenzyl esterase
MAMYRANAIGARSFSVAVLACLTGLAVTSIAQPKPASPQVRTKQGTLAGARTTDGIDSFKGVPFAQPPVGDLRWRAPMDPKPWIGVRPATQFSAACEQSLGRERLPWSKEFMVQNEASEDCLYLNLWTPSIAASAKLPVLVFIHGGGFNEGSGGIDVYDGTNLAKRKIVVITINYRVGLFGFFAHPELSAESPTHHSGDYGLLDQIEALKWVQQNVQQFGGDPAKVTIWGQSAGAMSVGDLMASPLAKGLFRAAVADSALSHSSALIKTMHDAEADGVAFAKSKNAASIKSLRAMSPQDLAGGNIRFPPVVDGWVLPEHPVKLLENGPDADVPLITGYDSEDGRSLGRAVHTAAEFRERVNSSYGQYASDLLKQYAVDSDKDAGRVWEELGRDKNRVAMYVFAEKRSKTHTSPTYTYFFDQAIPWPQHPEFGAFHTGELPYLFDNLQKLDRPWTQKDRDVSRITSGYLVNFVTIGKPNGAGLPEWKAVDSTPATMRLGSSFGPMNVASPQKEDLWMKILTSLDPTKIPTF